MISEELNEIRAKFNAIIETAQDAIITIDDKGVVNLFNPSAERMFGYISAEVIGKNVSLLMPQPDAANHDTYINNYTSSGARGISNSGRELVAKTKEGRTFPIILCVNPIKYESKSGFAGIIRDISKQKYTESINLLFGEVLNESINEVYIFEADSFQFVQVSYGAQQNMGYTMEELKKLTPVDIKPDYTVEQFHALTAPLVNGERKSITFQTTHQRKDKSVYPVEVSLQHTSISGRNLFFAIILDITKRIEANKELTDTKHRLEHLVQSSPVVIYAANAFGKYQATYISPNVERIIGYSVETFLHDPTFWRRSIHPDEVKAVVGGLKHLHKNGEHRHEYRFLLPSGEYEWFQGEMRLIYNETGEPLEIVGTWTNINERKESENELRVAKLQAEKANEAKSVFLSRMSHELRTPLNAILGFTQLLRRRVGDSEEFRNKTLGTIESAGWHLLNLVNDVLDISKIEGGESKRDLIDCRLPEIISECVSMFEAEAEALRHGISLHVESIDYIVKADPMAAKQVFINLIGNARKYNRANGSVTINANENKKGDIEIHVTDTGIGILEKDLEAIFEPFTRLSYTQKNIVEGTGIGLALVKQLVKDMQGEISVSSKQNEGSIFTVVLQKGTRSEQLLSQQTTDKVSSDNKVSVLYIEDDPSSRELMEIHFEHMKYATLTVAKNAREGLALAEEQDFDAFLIDINLPEIDGITLLKKLRENSKHQHCRMLALSADAMSHQIDMALAEGFADYLTKPVDLDKLNQSLFFRVSQK